MLKQRQRCSWTQGISPWVPRTQQLEMGEFRLETKQLLKGEVDVEVLSHGITHPPMGSTLLWSPLAKH